MNTEVTIVVQLELIGRYTPQQNYENRKNELKIDLL